MSKNERNILLLLLLLKFEAKEVYKNILDIVFIIVVIILSHILKTTDFTFLAAAEAALKGDGVF